MPLEAHEYLCARLDDFFDPATSWPRGLWTVGSVQFLVEVLEAARLTLANAAAARTLQEVRNSAKAVACADPGIGSSERRTQLRRLLDTDLRSQDSVEQLSHVTRLARRGYLGRWRPVLRAGQPADLERAARSIGAHLLDSGYSAQHLRRWLRAIRAGLGSADALLDAAIDLSRKPSRDYTVLVAFTRIPGAPAEFAEGWMTAAQVSEWLGARGHEKPRQIGGFTVSALARDPWAAVDRVSALVDRLQARVAIGLAGRNTALDAVPEVWVDGKNWTYPIRGSRRAIEVHSLGRQDMVLSLRLDDQADEVDFALELLAPLQMASDPSALAGGWATLESLYRTPGGGAHTASAGAAQVVAASWPRAELTRLAYAYSASRSNELGRALSAAPTNRVRAELMAKALAADPMVSFDAPSDECAAARLRQVLEEPRDVLRRVASHLERTFQRLYRQRNLLMHAGGVRSSSLAATLRTAPGLLGEAVDRAVHAHATEGIGTLALVARARHELEMVGYEGGRHVSQLLEQP